MTTVAIAKETRPGERRVALTPELVGKLTALGVDVRVEAGAGREANALDEEYRDAGAEVVAGDVLSTADVIFSVNSLDPDQVRKLKPSSLVLSFLAPTSSLDKVAAARDAQVTWMSMELVPRISRAQSMDALSSQALVAGYRCALIAADRLPKFFPLLMTAAGTIKPAQVVVLGAGVAGLQAIATAKRLGAVVQAYDVRAAAADEIRSMGAKFIDLDLDSLEGAGGYAREMTDDRAARQRDLLAPFIASADALITTAAIPGRSAPMLVTRAMVEAMKPGSVVVDLAAESGGNVEGSVAGEEVRIGNALVWGALNVPSQMPVAASRLYASNVVTLLQLMVKDGLVVVDFDDEIVAGACVTHAGQVRFEPAKQALDEGGAQ
ncbi:MAG TPA: Re/Si-specific NAD(P)(+) transhydrogenase subunit alpha [Actinomycetes bacterium]|nr:Re/Si-specific NAD(P)(+) transhydrogenase subunit alpha [Actinomycetes bacterium]